MIDSVVSALVSPEQLENLGRHFHEKPGIFATPRISNFIDRESPVFAALR